MPHNSHFLRVLKLNEVLHGLLLTHEFSDPKVNDQPSVCEDTSVVIEAPSASCV